MAISVYLHVTHIRQMRDRLIAKSPDDACGSSFLPSSLARDLWTAREGADHDTTRTSACARTAQIDQGPRTRMNKNCGTIMSVGTIITFLKAWTVRSG
ncbi:hypothetical protein DQW77_16855 [Roseovarius sp. TE539]|nr:hypothetical protein DQW77_16855 [Roseovarius sp. TE539]